eukprot:1137491-Pelagomonas_calceolata.AAC.1
MSSYRKQGGLLRGLLGDSQSPTHEHGFEEEFKAEEQRRSLEQQRVSPQGSLFSMDGPAPSSSVVGRSYLRTPSMQVIAYTLRQHGIPTCHCSAPHQSYQKVAGVLP